jgi:coenzyme Q-binding protein COQ10
MTRHTDRQLLPYSTRQLFDLVADIERYPEFIPWCRAARVISREGDTLLGELVVSFSHVTESYTSRVVLNPPEGDHTPCSIEARMVEGPFEHLVNHWDFTPEGARTRIDFLLDFKFRSKMLDMLMGGVFGKAAGKMADAFRKRADALYAGKD